MSVTEFSSASRIEKLSNRIAMAKRLSGLTYQEIADELRRNDPELRTSKSIVSNWCNQGVIPEGRALVLLPVVLNVDGHWLLTGEGEAARQLPAEETEAFRRIAEIVNLVQGGASISASEGAYDRAILRHQQVQVHRDDLHDRRGELPARDRGA